MSDAAPAVEPASAVGPTGPMPSRRVRLAVSGAVAVGSVLLRLPYLGRPGALVYDELFYVPDAADLARWGTEHGTAGHPPLGKWAIAAGLRLGGYEPFWWRLPSVLAGAVVCAAVAWGAIVLTRRAGLGAAAGALVALDGTVHVTSRLALLDVFLAAGTTVAVVALLSAWRARPDPARAWRWWTVAALATGAAAAVKWSGAALVPVVAVVGWQLAGSRRRRVLAVAVALLAPLAVIVLATLPRELGPDPVGPAGFVRQQLDVLHSQSTIRGRVAAEAAHASTWLWQGDPAEVYRMECPPADCGRPGYSTARIVVSANPVVWVVGLAGLGAVAVGARRRRAEAAILLAAVVALWGPWLLTTRQAFSFYEVALVPVLVLAAAWGAARIDPERLRLPLLVVLTLAVGGFAVLWPLWSAQPVGSGAYDWLTWWPGWS